MHTRSDTRFWFERHSTRDADCLQQPTRQNTAVPRGHGGTGAAEGVQPEESKRSNGHKWIPARNQVHKPSIRGHQNAQRWKSSNPALPRPGLRGEKSIAQQV